MNKKTALSLHQKLKGKLTIGSKVSLFNEDNLRLLYTPGVGEAVNCIKKNPESLYNLTGKSNSIAVVTDGSAVLGLGNVGPEAALPVMEGKCAIFNEFAGLDAYPICLKTQNVGEIVQTIKNISPGFGGINLEDISAPRCFVIERKLSDLDIPALHDDQHATAIIVLAGLINAVKVAGKNLLECKTVINGAGAAGNAIAKLLYAYGIRNILILDSKGIISVDRKDLDIFKKELLTMTNKNDISGNLTKAVEKSDILIGVSVKNIFTKNIINTMNSNPVVFALANPDPEIKPQDARRYGVKILATGRSDYPNQINNALVFPGFFKGLLSKKIKKVTSQMKIAAATAIAGLIKKPQAEYFIPKIFDRRLVSTVARSISNN